MCIESYRELKSRAQSTQKSMKLYLSNKDTEYILFKPIRMNIQAAYSQLQVEIQKYHNLLLKSVFQLLLWENYTQDERLLINSPTPEQISLQLSNK